MLHCEPVLFLCNGAFREHLFPQQFHRFPLSAADSLKTLTAFRFRPHFHNGTEPHFPVIDELTFQMFRFRHHIHRVLRRHAFHVQHFLYGQRRCHGIHRLFAACCPIQHTHQQFPGEIDFFLAAFHLIQPYRTAAMEHLRHIRAVIGHDHIPFQQNTGMVGSLPLFPSHGILCHFQGHISYLLHHIRHLHPVFCGLPFCKIYDEREKI